MKNFIRNRYWVLLALLMPLAVFLLGAKERGGDGGAMVPKSPAVTQRPDSYLMWINNILMPLNSQGVIANVRVPLGTGSIEGGKFEDPNKEFLFSGGFMLSGYSDGALWANAVASASRIYDYEPGAIGGDPSKNGMYVVDRSDPPFGESWQIWKDAVSLGADFYDGDGDTIYNPVDKNGDGVWNPDEDAPDFLGDQTVWTVFNDNLAAPRRRWTAVNPQKIDIQQTMFGFRSAGAIGNMLFLRYRIINRNPAVPVMDSCFFAVWADPDLGAYTDDLVGCDTTLDAGYTWNDGPDDVFGAEAPTFFISFFQGPIVDGEPTDTAYNVRGQLLGVDTLVGKKNLGLSSFVNYVQSNPTRGDPANHFEARYYMEGRLKDGTILDPCADPFGSVFGMPCGDVPKTFWYSGDPVTNFGWIYTTPGDMRQMQNIGPFQLKKDEPVDVVVAYVVGKGSDARNSVAVARTISELSERIYDANFEGAPSPPLARPVIRTEDNKIELIWDTHEQVGFSAVNDVLDYDLRFEAFEVTMYRRNSTAATVAGVENARIIARYDVANNYTDILTDNIRTGERTPLLRGGTQLDSATYATPGRGRIRLTIDTDPFTGGPILKGKPYFFSIVGYALNHRALRPVNPLLPTGPYYLSGAATVGFTANSPAILNSAAGGIRPGVDFNVPYLVDAIPERVAGATEGNVYYDEVNKSAITGNEYEVSFFKNQASSLYRMFWRLTNATTGQVKLDSMPDNLREATAATYTLPLVDGILVRPVGVDPGLKTAVYTPSANAWYRGFVESKSGIYYLGADVTATLARPTEFVAANALAKVEKMRKVEIRFGPTQKAYRYIRSGSLPRYEYAGSMPRSLDTLPNWRVGYVDVPFQIWVKDARYGQERQLNCAFLETTFAGGRPDGVWDPGTAVDTTKEYILIFDTPYSTDTLLQYTGGTFNAVTRWANVLLGWTPAAQWPSDLMTAEQKAIAADRYLGAIYVVGLERRSATSFYQQGDVLTIPIRYPFTSADVFRFRTKPRGENLTLEDKKRLFDKVNVYPNPLFAHNPTGSYLGRRADEPFVTFSNLPEEVTIKIYSLSGSLLRVLTESDKALGAKSPFLEWDLKNDSGLRVASGMYLAIVTSPNVGEKVLKFAIIMPQKQIQRF